MNNASVFTDEELRNEIRRRIADSGQTQKHYAINHGYSPQYLGDFLSGSRAPSGKILAGEGLQAHTVYYDPLKLRLDAAGHNKFLAAHLLGAHPLTEAETQGSHIADRALRAQPAVVGEPWIAVEDQLPPAGEEVIVWAENPLGWGLALDTWDEQHEAPVGWSSFTIPIGHGWDSGLDFHQVTHWMRKPDAPAALLGGEGGQDSSHLTTRAEQASTTRKD